jgi:uncharacterized protein (DUF2235 family)
MSEQPKQKRLAVFLDGTWNAVRSNTNVWRLKSLCAAEGADGLRQLTYYDVGVNGFWGGVFGRGLIANIEDAYSWLIENYSEGDEIFIFGFSRGAYTARSLSGLIMRYGLLKPGSPLGISQVIDRYKASAQTLWKIFEDKERGIEQNLTLEEQWLVKYSLRVKIKLVAVWDTVGALGVPAFNIEGISRSKFNWLDTGLRLSLENAFHAVSIDDHRRSFAPTLWTKRIPSDPKEPVAPPRPLTSVEQRWFVGAHGNIGGGYISDLLAQVPLLWVMQKAQYHGLSFRYGVDIDGDVFEAPIADSYKAFMGGAYAGFSWRHYRPIGSEPIAEENSKHITVNETIDASVFERWRRDDKYRPQNLNEWSNRKRVVIENLHTSVKADDASSIASEGPIVVGGG